jgi:hypothetical protein
MSGGMTPAHATEARPAAKNNRKRIDETLQTLYVAKKIFIAAPPKTTKYS